MSTYKVKNIVDILGVRKETVCGWIRSGKLHGTMSSKRDGYIVEDSDLKEFVKYQTKYLKAYRQYKMSVLIKIAAEQLKKPEVRQGIANYIAAQQMIMHMKLEVMKMRENEGR